MIFFTTAQSSYPYLTRAKNATMVKYQITASYLSIINYKKRHIVDAIAPERGIVASLFHDNFYHHFFLTGSIYETPAANR